ncbi:nef protein [Simian immunodeficiency virus]|uniref:Protein Nef n=1 Tax=Simian immunodeficiency virus TaxID=11723 RepID=V5TB17_SIV|nr:nef protein [Simian immunodeficiency virus]
MGSILSCLRGQRPSTPGGLCSRLFGTYWYRGVQTYRFLRHFRGGYDLRRVAGVEHLNILEDGYLTVPRALPNCPCPLCYRHPSVYYHSPEPEDADEEEGGCFVQARVPVRQGTIKLLVDISCFLKEKGGLEGIIRTPERDDLIELYAYIEWGVLKGWLEYEDETDENMQIREERKPLVAGWLWKLVFIEQLGQWAYSYDMSLLSINNRKKKPQQQQVAVDTVAIETPD